MTIDLLIVDDHKIFRQGLRALLDCESDINVISEAANGDEALKLLKKLKPDVLVADLRMPGLNGIELTRAASQASPKTATVVLSMFGDEVYALESLEAGAWGYVIKESSFEDLVTAIHEALAHRYFISPTLNGNNILYKLKQRKSERETRILETE